MTRKTQLQAIVLLGCLTSSPPPHLPQPPPQRPAAHLLRLSPLASWRRQPRLWVCTQLQFHFSLTPGLGQVPPVSPFANCSVCN